MWLSTIIIKQDNRRLAISINLNMRYKVKLNKTEEGYAVWCPSLPGCWSQGQTEKEALENIKDAILAYFDTKSEA